MTDKQPDPGRLPAEALSAEDVRHIAVLCRIGMTEAEVERMREELVRLLDEVSVLRRVDTAGVEPTGHSVEGIHTVMRADEPREPLAVADVLANAARREGDFIRVRAVIE